MAMPKFMKKMAMEHDEEKKGKRFDKKNKPKRGESVRPFGFGKKY